MPHLPKMPSASIYEKEYIYWPWGRLLRRVADWVKSNAPHSAFVVDYMCGTGYLLNQIAALRSDLTFAGCSLTPLYIDYAKKNYSHLDIVLQDALEYSPKKQPDIVISTAGLHHLNRSKQPEFIKKVASELSRGKYFLLGEELIAEYNSEKERRLAVVEMCSALLSYAIKADAPQEVVEAASDILDNDLFERGEYKTCQSKLMTMLESYFSIEEVHNIWPSDLERFGDVLFICRRK